MSQNTTKEFSFRLRQAVDGNPMAPPSDFGRQAWLREKLQKEAGLKVSPNTLHKWFNGTARPREDNIRTIAKVLSVDDVWLALGRRPLADASSIQEQATRANGATLVLAGLFEMKGSRVTFPSDDDGVNLWVDSGKGRIGLTVVTPQVKGEAVSFIVPEPVGSNRIVSLGIPDQCDNSVCMDILDLTDCPRQNFGGFSVIQAEVRDGGRIKLPQKRSLVSPLGDLNDLVSA